MYLGSELQLELSSELLKINQHLPNQNHEFDSAVINIRVLLELLIEGALDFHTTGGLLNGQIISFSKLFKHKIEI